jgi:hypothetical protein
MKADLPDTDALSAAVLEFFSTQGSKKHTAYTVAKKFGLEHAEAKEILDTLYENGKLNSCLLDISQGRWYSKICKKKGGRHTLTVSVKHSEVETRPYKEYKPGVEWNYAKERLADFKRIKSKF